MNTLFVSFKSFFNPAKAIEDQRLRNHLFRFHDSQERKFCEVLCFMKPNCVSCNLKEKDLEMMGHLFEN